MGSMKRFDDTLTFSHSRHVGVKPERMSEIFKVSGICKGYSTTSRMHAHHYIGSLVGNLAESLMLQRNLAIRLSDPEPTPKVKGKILEALKTLGLVKEIRKGYSYKSSSLEIPKSDLTKIEPNQRILNVFDPTSIVPSKSWSIVVRRGNDEILVKSHDRDHKILYNSSLKFQRRVNVPIKGFKRIFNEDLDRGGRIYSNYQQMSKEMRSLITIDGEETIELDYRYNQIRMLFALAGVHDEGDPYDGFDIERSIVKKAMNTLVNANNPKRVFCDMRFTAPFRWSCSEAERFIDKAYERYPILQSMEGSGIGLRLQKIEGDISLAMMSEALYNDFVVLPIHDSFVVKKSESAVIEANMERVWQNVVGASKIWQKCGV